MSHVVDHANQLDTDLAKFLDWWKKTFSVKQFIVGVHSWLDEISLLNIDEKPKGNLLLRQTSLQLHEKNILVGAASGSFSVLSLRSALQNEYQKSQPIGGTMTTSTVKNLKINGSRRNRDCPSQGSYSTRRTCYTFKCSSPCSELTGAVVDFGLYLSAVGRVTIDCTMKFLGLGDEPDLSPVGEIHRFGKIPDERRLLCANKFPFNCTSTDGKTYK